MVLLTSAKNGVIERRCAHLLHSLHGVRYISLQLQGFDRVLINQLFF